MKEFFAKVLLMYFGSALIFVTFGLWSPLTLVAGLVGGFIYMIFT